MIVDHICVNFGAPLFQELFHALHQHDLEQNVFYPRNTRHRQIDFKTSYQIDSPLVLSFLTKASFSKKRKLMQKAYDPSFHRNKPDILHAHTLFSDGSLAYHYYQKYKVPFVVAIRSTDLDVFLKWKPWLKPYGQQILDHASTIVFISPSLKKRFTHIFGSTYEAKSQIVPNGIHSLFLKAGAPRVTKPDKPLKLIYAGSFLKRKKVPGLIRFVEGLDAKLTIVGQGGDQENKVLRMLRQSEKASYLGHIEDPSDLVKLYRQHDIFIMISKAETFGLVYIEAMSQGLPLLYSKGTGIDGLFEEGAVGYGVKPGSLSEMNQAIRKIMASYQEISYNCVSEAQQFNWTNLAKKYMEIYKLMIGPSAEPEQA